LLLVFFISIALGVNDGYSQQRLTKKERKRQDREAKADRLFIEGQKFLMLEEYEKAYFYFGKALEYKPESGAINFKIAEILARANENDEALKYGQKAVEADPDNKYYHLLIAEVYNKQQKPEQAAEVLNSLMENSDDNQQYILELASLYLASRDFDNALDALDRAEEYYGIVPQITFQKQKIYLQKNDLESAIMEGLNLVEQIRDIPNTCLHSLKFFLTMGKRIRRWRSSSIPCPHIRISQTFNWPCIRFIRVKVIQKPRKNIY